MNGVPRLRDYVHRFPRVRELIQTLQTDRGRRILLSGLKASYLSYLIGELSLSYEGDILVISSDKELASGIYSDLLNFEIAKNPRLLPDSFQRPLYFEKTDAFQIQQRIEIINGIDSDKNQLIVSYPEAIFEKLPMKKVLRDMSINLTKGGIIELDRLIEDLVGHGFRRSDFVYEPGEFSIRGNIIDIYSFAAANPYRIELFDEEIEQIRTFDPESQLSLKSIAKLSLVPHAQDNFQATEKTSILEAISENAIVICDDWELLKDKLNYCVEQAERFEEKMVHFAEEDQVNFIINQDYTDPVKLFDELNRHHLIAIKQEVSFLDFTHSYQFKTEAQTSFNKNFKLLIKDLLKHQEKGYQIFISSDSPRQLERLHNIFEDLASGVRFTPHYKSISEGYVNHDQKYLIYTDHQIFSRYHGHRRPKKYRGNQAFARQLISDLKTGDFITHIDHGVGRFAGMENLTINGKKQEALRIIYKNDDILYVSIHSLHKVTKYVGKDGTAPKLSKLGSENWRKLKARTKARVKDIARELILLYSKRKKAKGYAFSPDNYLQHELEASFIYEDTPDQLKATEDVKADMEKPHPMDRLICGDVGFGKTEVAMRAAFKAVQDGKQVAVLTPTTILALQHFKTFKERFKGFPIDVDYISRFRTGKEKTQIIEELAKGKIDIIIGTHALLNKKVDFKDLGLFIIDEEQKFGVAAKERLRHFKVNVDTLILTATPIPRTLQFSLMAARDLSIIQTAPPNRQPIYTQRRAITDDFIQQSISDEVYRGGQVFFVHNRVQSLGEMATMIMRLCSDVDVGVAHGQMDAKKLERVLMDFIDHKYDVLVCTNIIETGLDIPNANTMIINNAHQFGLSDLHQLRGRVGRSNKRAYCYLLTPPLHSLSPESRRRIKTVEEFSDLGSGFQIAMRDMDIRGAGNLLGAEQSGFIIEMGYDTYQKVLAEAVKELKEDDFKELFKGEKEEKLNADVTLEMDIEMFIPDSYIAQIDERLNVYRRMDEMTSEGEIKQLLNELRDRFGPLPEQVHEIVKGLRVKWLSAPLGFERVNYKNNKLILFFPVDAQSNYYDSDVFRKLLDKINVDGGEKGVRMRQSHKSLKVVVDQLPDLDAVLEILNWMAS